MVIKMHNVFMVKHSVEFDFPVNLVKRYTMK